MASPAAVELKLAAGLYTATATRLDVAGSVSGMCDILRFRRCCTKPVQSCRLGVQGVVTNAAAGVAVTGAVAAAVPGANASIIVYTDATLSTVSDSVATAAGALALEVPTLVAGSIVGAIAYDRRSLAAAAWARPVPRFTSSSVVDQVGVLFHVQATPATVLQVVAVRSATHPYVSEYTSVTSPFDRPLTDVPVGQLPAAVLAHLATNGVTHGHQLLTTAGACHMWAAEYAYLTPPPPGWPPTVSPAVFPGLIAASPASGMPLSTIERLAQVLGWYLGDWAATHLSLSSGGVAAMGGELLEMPNIGAWWTVALASLNAGFAAGWPGHGAAWGALATADEVTTINAGVVALL